MRVYIAGALSSKENVSRTPSQVVVDYIANVHKMCLFAGIVRKEGMYPYVPGLDLLLGVVDGDFNEEHYRGIGMSFLDVCDAVLVTSMSWGVEQELKRAAELDIPCFTSVNELCKYQDELYKKTKGVIKWQKATKPLKN
jgi:hypothetical protein